MNNQTTTSSTNTSGQNTQQNCPNCNMPKQEWLGNNGQGFQMGDKTYCCQGCATGTGCTCK